jgi:dipeptidyl aminopeptidase/acylaminoacyl peptidase
MRPALEGVLNADWSPDGNSMAVLRAIDGRFRLEYPIGKVLITGLDFPLMAMRVSPDGTRVAYVYFHEGSSIALSVVDGDRKRQMLTVVSDQSPNRIDPSIAWSPDGKEILYRSFDPKEWGTIYAVDMKGRRRVVTRVPGHVTLYDIARDGRMLIRTDNRQVGILGAGPGDKTERDLSCLDASSLFGISEDGSAIVAMIVGESGGPKGSVYLRKTDGSPPIRLGDGAAWAFSPDGKWVSSFTSANQLTRKYVLLPTGAGEEREVAIPELKGLNVVFGWSRDDETLYVMGKGKTKDGYQYYAWNTKSGALRTIGPSGVRDGIPLVSPDRNSLLTYGPDGRLWVYPVERGEARLVTGLSAHDSPIAWRTDNSSLYVVTHHDENRMFPVSVLDLATGKKTPWREIRPARPVEQVLDLQVTPDGRAYAYNFLVKTSDLYVAEGAR